MQLTEKQSLAINMQIKRFKTSKTVSKHSQTSTKKTAHLKSKPLQV